MNKSTKRPQKKRGQTADELVSSSASTSNVGKKWTLQLSPEDTTYVCMVIRAMKKTPGAALYVVARKLKEELGLKVSHDTIAKTLKELIKDA